MSDEETTGGGLTTQAVDAWLSGDRDGAKAMFDKRDDAAERGGTAPTPAAPASAPAAAPPPQAEAAHPNFESIDDPAALAAAAQMLQREMPPEFGGNELVQAWGPAFREGLTKARDNAARLDRIYETPREIVENEIVNLGKWQGKLSELPGIAEALNTIVELPNGRTMPLGDVKGIANALQASFVHNGRKFFVGNLPSVLNLAAALTRRDGKDVQREIDQMLRQRPPGSSEYGDKNFQARLRSLFDQQAADAQPIVGMGGRSL